MSLYNTILWSNAVLYTSVWAVDPLVEPLLGWHSVINSPPPPPPPPPYLATSHYLNRCWLNVDFSLGNKLQRNWKQNTKLFLHENAFKNIVCETAAISSMKEMSFIIFWSWHADVQRQGYLPCDPLGTVHLPKDKAPAHTWCCNSATTWAIYITVKFILAYRCELIWLCGPWTSLLKWWFVPHPTDAHTCRSVHGLCGFTKRRSDWLTCVRL